MKLIDWPSEKLRHRETVFEFFDKVLDNPIGTTKGDVKGLRVSDIESKGIDCEHLSKTKGTNHQIGVFVKHIQTAVFS